MFVQLSLSFRLKRLLQGSTSTFIFANVLCDLQRIYFPGISKQTRPHAKTYCKSSGAKAEDAFPIEIKDVSPNVGKGLFATRPIKEGEILFRESPLISSQLMLSKQFVRACEECQRFLNIHHKQVAGFLPPSATPYLPKRYPHIYNYQLAEGFRYHYCSAECLGNGYTHFHQLIDAHARTNMWPDLVVQKERIESDWSVILPTVPPDMIIRAICLEIEATNPKLNPFHSRSSSLDHGDNKRHKASDTKHTKSGGREERSKLDKSSSSRASREAALSKRTPKQRLKILEQFKPSKKSLEELIPLSELLAEYVSLLLLDYAPFNIEPPLIMDIARRIYNNHHTIVLGVHDDKNLAKYMENFPRIVREGTTEQKEKKMLEDSDKELRASGAGGLPLLWHPVASALYSAQGLINHSCSPNVYYSTIHHDVHNIDVIAARSIATGEEITASYLDPSLLTLPVQSRRAHLSSNFGFQCECLACKIQSSPKS